MAIRFQDYQNPALAADLVIFGWDGADLRVMLLNRAEPPFEGSWTLPGAFVRMDETLTDTCARVLKDKLGLANVFLEQLSTFDKLDRDPRGRVVAVAYYALINPATVSIVAGSMANDVRWMNARRLPKLGFDHRAIVKAAWARLQGKIRYAPIGFQLLDESFTMPELHALYKCILDTEIDRRNFSRKMLSAGLVAATGELRAMGKSRPAELFRFNKTMKDGYFNLSL